MNLDKHVKNTVIGYTLVLLANKGALDQDLRLKILSGNEDLIRKALEKRRDELKDEARKSTTNTEEQLLQSQAGSVQEVLDNLSDLLKL